MQKLLLIILSFSLFCVCAEEQKTLPANDKAVEFYAGISLGWDHMVTKRQEELVTGTNRYFAFSEKSQVANGITGKIITGFLWTIPNTSFALSPEIYLGQGSAEITKKGSAHDPFIPADKEFQSTLRQRLTMGFVLRAGYYLTNNQNNLLYLLVGIDQSKFENKFTLSSSDVGGPVPSLFEKRSKILRSPVIGFGFERKFNKLKIGIDLRYVNYKAWGKYSPKVNVSRDIISIKFKPRIISTTLNFCYLF